MRKSRMREKVLARMKRIFHRQRWITRRYNQLRGEIVILRVKRKGKKERERGN